MHARRLHACKPERATATEETPEARRLSEGSTRGGVRGGASEGGRPRGRHLDGQREDRASGGHERHVGGPGGECRRWPRSAEVLAGRRVTSRGASGPSMAADGSRWQPMALNGSRGHSLPCRGHSPSGQRAEPAEEHPEATRSDPKRPEAAKPSEVIRSHRRS